MTNPIHPIVTSAVMVEDGDLLIIGISKHLSAAEAQRVTAALGDEIGPNVRLAVLESVSGMAVVKRATRETTEMGA